jgi:hypothetical protein
MAEIELRRPSVFLVTEGGQASAEGISITLEVDAVPAATMTLHRGKDEVQKPLAADVISRMRKYQTTRLAGKSAPDTQIEVTDGAGNTLVFFGYAAAPVLGIAKGATHEQIHVVGKDSILDSLDLSIYDPLPARTEERDRVEGYTQTPIEADGDVPRMIAEIVDTLFSNYPATREATGRDSFRRLLEAQHAINGAEPYTALSDILFRSDVKYETWPELIEEYPSLSAAIVQHTLEMLQQSSGSFWSTLNGLMQDFQMFYRPDPEGSGALFRNDTKLAGETTKTIHITQAQITDGSQRLLQLGGVVIIGPVLADYYAEEQKSLEKGGIVGQWPDVLGKGFIKRLPPPVWVACGGHLTFSEVEETDTVKAKVYDIANYISKKTGIELKLKKADKTIGERVLGEYARVIYTDKRLADSTATLSIPLDVSIQVGRRYRFELEDGGSFVGFLRGLTHSLQLQGGKTLSQGTQLFLTHIEF